MYLRTLGQEIGDVLKVWRLKNNKECWQLFLWEIHLHIYHVVWYRLLCTYGNASTGYQYVYIWSLKNRYLVTWNLRHKTLKSGMVMMIIKIILWTTLLLESILLFYFCFFSPPRIRRIKNRYLPTTSKWLYPHLACRCLHWVG